MARISFFFPVGILLKDLCQNLLLTDASMKSISLHCRSLLLFSFVAGCFNPPPVPPDPEPAAPQPAQAAQSADVQQFDPAAGKTVVDTTRPITDPITGPLAALQNAREKIPQLAIQHAISLFHASEGRYPATLEEFMTRIIQENRINLPQLAPGLAWEYDVDAHQLVVVQSPKKP